MCIGWVSRCPCVVFGDFPLPQPTTHSIDSGERYLRELITGLTAPAASRLTVDAALENHFLQSVRVVNGVAIETMFAHIQSDDAADAGGFEGGSLGGDFSTSSFEMLRLDSIPTMRFELHDASCTAASQLNEFIRDEGPIFQIVRTAHNLTLYGKSDPRRRQRQRPSVSFRVPDKSGASLTAPPGDSRRSSATSL